MKKMLFLTILIIAVPSFFILLNKKEDKTYNPKEELVLKDNINIRVLQVNKNKILELDLEDYVRGVIAGEMPISFDIEALKAQAVAARTYALRRINVNNKYDVVDTVMNQVYIDDEALKLKWGNRYEEYMLKINNAVNSTKGEYVDYNGTYADTLFFSTSVGNTENSEEVFGNKVSYLRSVSSEWDSEVSPVYEESKIFTRDEFCNKLGLIDCSKIYFSILDSTSTGRIKKLTINNKTFSGSTVAYYLGIRSNYFNIKIENNKVVITTRGFGHGVGMSQYGAEGMASNGYLYKEILEHYYKGTKIKNLYV